jgi:hypothetical protein
MYFLHISYTMDSFVYHTTPVTSTISFVDISKETLGNCFVGDVQTVLALQYTPLEVNVRAVAG